MKSLLSIGECMVEMASVGDGLYRQGFAGDTFNAAWHARRALPADWTVDYYTAVGDDALSTRMLEFVQAQNIATRHVRRIANASPGLYVIELKNGEREFTYWRGQSAARLMMEDVAAFEHAVRSASAILFSGITLAILTPGDRATLLSELAKAKARGAMVAFDSNIRMRLWPDRQEARNAIRAAIATTTLALPSGDDEHALFGDEDIASRYATVPEIVIKNGAGSAKVTWPNGEATISPERQITPIDTTGAGDSFNGTYIAARLLGDPPESATHKAHAVAGRVIQAYGALIHTT